MLSATDGLNRTTAFTLDAFGDTTKTTDPTGRFTTAVINNDGETTGTAGGPSGGGQDIIDAVGNQVKSIDADGNVVFNQFDAAGRLISSTDALGNRTQWQYDKAGNKIGEIMPNGATVTWQYDAADRLTGSTDQLRRSETYGYDADNRLTTETWKNAAGVVVNTETFTYVYTATGATVTASDVNGTITSVYDILGRLTSQTDVWGLVTTFGYDANNNLISQIDSLGGTATNTYDAANELTDTKFSDTSGDALSIKYGYDAAGELTAATRYSDATETTKIEVTNYGPDNAGRTLSIAHNTAAGGIIDGFNYAYNAAGQVSLQNSALGPAATDSYDAAGQLLSDGTKANSFDAEGNRTNSGDVTTTDNELTTDGVWNYSYDATGDETQKVKISTGETWSYGYDNANRLVSAQHKPTSNGAVDIQVNYTYDVLGNRIAESVTTNGTTTVTKSAYDRNGNAWADLSATGTLITRRLYGDAVDNLLARIDANGVAWYLKDNLGSVRDIINSTGTLIDHRDYDSFGNIIAETHPTSGDRYGWTGREFDAETNLQYNRARWYDPNSGRWLSQDPLGFGAGDSNLYRYATNDPTNFVDPSGMDPPGFFGTIGFALSNPWQTTKIVVGSVAGDVYNGGRALVTGQAGAALGDRAVAITERSSGTAYQGTGGQNLNVAAEIGLQLIGVTPIAESIAGADAPTGRQIPTDERIQRGAAGVAAYSGTAAGAAGLVRAVAPTTSVVVTGQGIVRLPNPVPTFSALPGSAAAAGVLTPISNLASQTRSAAIQRLRAFVQELQAAGETPATAIVAYDVRTGAIVAVTSGDVPAVVAPELAQLAENAGGLGVTTACQNTIGTCAEFRAANQLLQNGSRLQDIRFTNAMRPRNGQVIPPCDNCQQIFGSNLAVGN